MTIIGEAWVAIHGQTAGVGREVTAGVDKELAEVDKAGERHGKRFGSAFSQAATGDVTGGLKSMIPEVAIATAVVAGVGSLAKLGASFTEVSDNIRVQTGATGAKLDGLNATFKHVATEVPDSFKDTGVVVADLAQKLGLTGKPLDDLSVKFLNLAHITHGDVNAQMDSTIQLFRNFDVAGKDQSATLDMLYRASQASGIGFDQLSSQLTAAGPTLRQVGLNAAQGAAFIATLTKAGVDASQVMPGLAKAAATAAKEHKSAAEVFGQTFDRIKNAKTDVEASGVALQVFGARAGPRMATLIREGKLSYQDMLATIQGGKDTINKSTEDTEHFGEKWDKFKNKILVGLAPIASSVFDAIGRGMDNIGVVTGPVVDLLGQLGDSFNNLFASVGGPLEAIKISWGSLIDGFTGGAGTADHEIGGLAQTFARIGAVVQGVVTFMSSLWNQHAAEIHKILGQLAATFQSEFQAIAAVITVVVNIITALWDRFGNTLLGKIRVAFDAILTIISGALETIKGIFDLVTAILTGKWGKAWDAIKEILAGVWKTITGIVRLGIDEISTIFEAAKALISAAWSAIWHGIATLVNDIVIAPAKRGFDDFVGFVTGLPGRIAGAAHGLFDGIKDAFKSAINWIINGWNSLKFSIPSIDTHIPGVGKIGGGSFGVPTIPPLRAAGGPVTGGSPYIVGEVGPELFVPGMSGSIIPNSALQALLATIPAGWTMSDYVSNLVKTVQIALQSAEGLIVDWAERLGSAVIGAFETIGSSVDALKLDDLSKSLGDLGSAASSAASAISSAASQMQQAAQQAQQQSPQQQQNQSSGGGDDAFHAFYTSQPGDVQQYLWSVGHPGGEPFPGVETYDSGGWLMPGMTMAQNLSGAPERVMTGDQLAALAAAGGSSRPIVLHQENTFTGTTEDLMGYVDEANQRLVQSLVAEIAAGATPGAM